jgi:hypothetical protein
LAIVPAEGGKADWVPKLETSSRLEVRIVMRREIFGMKIWWPEASRQMQRDDDTLHVHVHHFILQPWYRVVLWEPK